MKHSIDCVSFKPLRKGTLVGFADILIRELKLTIHDVTLHEKGAERWASPPGRPWIKDGAVVTDAEGKIQYSQTIEFGDRGTRNAFSQAVWRAVETFRGRVVKILYSTYRAKDWFDLPPRLPDAATLQPSDHPSDLFDIESDDLDEMLMRRAPEPQPDDMCVFLPSRSLAREQDGQAKARRKHKER